MSRLRSWLRFHGEILAVLVRDVLCATDKGLFAALFNLRAGLRGRKARIRWDGALFRVTDPRLPGIEYRFRHQRQGLMAWEYGMVERGTSLGKDYMLDRIAFRPGDKFIDCGANTGDIKLWFAVNNIAIDYTGFEPSPVEFACLAANVAPGAAHNVGLWNAEGSLKFYVSSQGADSSLIEPEKYDSTIEIKTHRLDRHVTGRVRCLKLEAEGAEPEILEGLGEKLVLVDYVAADLWYERGVGRESTLVPVTNYLLARGFDLVEVNYRRLCVLYRNRAAG